MTSPYNLEIVHELTLDQELVSLSLLFKYETICFELAYN
jgi:hypothetical protein